MKTIVATLASSLLVASFLFSSCKKDDSGSNNSSANLAAGKSRITFDYSGKVSGSFSSNDLVSTAVKNSALYNINGGAVNGTTASTALFVLDAATPTGVHAFKTASKTATLDFEFSLGSDGWAASAGDTTDFTLNITKSDGAVFEGSFSGTLTNNAGEQVKVSNGQVAGKF